MSKYCESDRECAALRRRLETLTADLSRVTGERLLAIQYIPTFAKIVGFNGTYDQLTSGWCEELCNHLKQLAQAQPQATERITTLEYQNLQLTKRAEEWRQCYQSLVGETYADDLIEQLKKREAGLVGALKPFAAVWQMREAGIPFDDALIKLYPVDFEDAQAALVAVEGTGGVK